MFETALSDMVFETAIRVAQRRRLPVRVLQRLEGVYVLLPYNLIEQEVDTPMICNGYAFFDSGEACSRSAIRTSRRNTTPCRSGRRPTRATSSIRDVESDSFLYKIGNHDIVRGMAECHEVLNLIAKEDTYADLYRRPRQADERHPRHLLLDRQAGRREPGRGARRRSETRPRRRSASSRRSPGYAGTRRTELDAGHRSRPGEIVRPYQVGPLRDDRRLRRDRLPSCGRCGARSSRCATCATSIGDASTSSKNEVSDDVRRLAQQCVEFLLRPDDRSPPTKQRVAAARRPGSTAWRRSPTPRSLEEEVDAAAGELEMLIEIVSNLKIDDATQRTAIIDNISTIFSRLNQDPRGAEEQDAGAGCRVEGAAEFASQLKLLNQASSTTSTSATRPRSAKSTSPS